ncbi:MAG: winged helix DNA-binding protein, partial [Methanosarcinales archaeon]|nr:winged helix DNA-binding protein [Methanosarcinales archaeon]
MGGVNLILQQKPALTLLSIRNEGGTYASVISREIESTFAHTTNILNKLEEQGLVTFEPDGSDNRVKRVELTPKGQDAAELVDELAAVLEGKKTGNVQKNKASSKKKAIDFAKKIEMIKTRIDLISNEELSAKKSVSQEDYGRIGRRLGPYRRELHKIMKYGRKGDVKQAEALDEEIRRLFEERERLR